MRMAAIFPRSSQLTAASGLLTAALAAGTIITTPLSASAAPSAPQCSVRASSAGTKTVGQTTNTWGTAVGAPNAPVWTEVLLPTGWSRSQERRSDASGYFVIPLTYGSNQPGTTTWRVAARSQCGQVYSPTFTLTRTPVTVVAHNAGPRRVGQATNTWGTAQGAPHAEVWTEVRLPSGAWSRSRTGRTSGTGAFVLPLTYGINSAGTTTWRVAVRTPAGVARSATFTLTRLAAPTGTRAEAVAAARDYLSFSAFSRSGLIEQLEYEDISRTDAIYAVDYLQVDWKAQARRKAKQYLDVDGYSRLGLVDQLEFEGFTTPEAIHGVDRLGANWNDQAVRVARDYLRVEQLTRQELIQQLLYDEFTASQAEHAANVLGLR